MTDQCEKCHGTGKITYRTIGDAMPTDIGNGLTIQEMSGYGTRACECVRDRPAIDGKATWWESESVYDAVVNIWIGNEAVEVRAESEVPRDENGQRVNRTAANAYYPPLVQVETPCSLSMHADTARELAATLAAAADACDKADELAMQTAQRDEGYGATESREISF